MTRRIPSIYLIAFNSEEGGSYWDSDSSGFYSTLSLENAKQRVKQVVKKYRNNTLRNATIKIYQCDPCDNVYSSHGHMCIVHITRLRDANIVFEGDV